MENQDYNLMREFEMQQNPYFHRIGFGKRLGAALIDFLLVGVTVTIIAFATGFFYKYAPYFNDLSGINEFFKNKFLIREYEMALLKFNLLASLPYYLTEILFAASPGKMIFGIKIGTIHQTKAQFSNLLIRFIIKHLSLMIDLVILVTALQFLHTASSLSFFVILIGFFFTLSEKKLAFHDMIAKTAVYYSDDLKTENI